MHGLLIVDAYVIYKINQTNNNPSYIYLVYVLRYRYVYLADEQIVEHVSTVVAQVSGADCQPCRFIVHHVATAVPKDGSQAMIVLKLVHGDDIHPQAWRIVHIRDMEPLGPYPPLQLQRSAPRTRTIRQL